MFVPHSDCHCDKCMIKYYEQGLIHEGTPAYEDVKRLIEKENKNSRTKGDCENGTMGVNRKIERRKQQIKGI